MLGVCVSLSLLCAGGNNGCAHRSCSRTPFERVESDGKLAPALDKHYCAREIKRTGAPGIYSAAKAYLRSGCSPNANFARVYNRASVK